jgi:hypothetical protein
MVNVPTAVWIDEQGRVVRPPEVAYSKEQKVLGNTIGDDRYIVGLRDWVANGEQSRYVMSPEKLKQRLQTAPIALRRADAEFKLGTHFHAQGDADEAAVHWKAAQELNPDSWNYHRQQWSFDSKTAFGNWFRKFRALDGEPYYAPLDLPEEE